MKKIIYSFTLFLLSASMMMGQTLYDADFSTEDEGFPDHTTSNPPAAGPASASGGVSPDDWTVSYVDAPSTDGSANEFSVNSGVIRIQDWGDTAAEWISSSIDVSGVDAIDIEAIGETIGGGVQNGGTEFFEYFYILDGTEVIVDIPLSGESAGTPVNLSVLGLDVSANSTLEVGFRFLVNGGGDGYEISSVTVTEQVLPVELTKFNVTKRSNNTNVSWQTATEINNDRFEIERSNDANRFETIGKVKGEGNSQRLVDYSFVDDQPLTGVNYYRLKQVDIDGAFAYSDVVSIQMGSAPQIRIAPTSTFDFLTVSTGAESSITVSSLNGQIMNQQSSKEGNFTVEMANYPQGIYFLTINTNGTVQTEKVVRL